MKAKKQLFRIDPVLDLIYSDLKRSFTDEIVATCTRYLVTEINTQSIIQKTGMYLFKHLYRPDVAEFHNLQFDMDSAEKRDVAKALLALNLLYALN